MTEPVPVQIRRLLPEDAAALYQLRLNALRESPEAFGSTYEETVQTGVSSISERLARAEAEFFYLGAFVDGMLKGMVAVSREHGRKSWHKAFVVSMYVSPEQRGHGTGRALIADAIGRARAMPGLKQLHLSVVTTNTSARALYRSLGFTAYGVEPNALRQDDQYWDEELMVLPLSRGQRPDSAASLAHGQ